MNRLKSWREIIILAAAAAVLLLFIIFRSAGNINYELPVFEKLDKEEITAVSVEGNGMLLDFSREDGRWLIEPERWIAADATMNSIVSAVTDMKAVDLISSSGKADRFDLDEERRLTLTASGDDGVLRTVYVGKVSSSGIYTYVMFPGDEGIYSIRGDLPSRIAGDKNSLREKEILTVDRNGVLKMSLTTDGGKLTVFDDGTGTGTWRGEGDFEADGEKIKSVIPVLSPLRCKDFLPELPGGSPEWKLDILTESGSVSLEIWPETPEGYPARSSENGYPVMLTKYTAENILGAFGLVFE